MKEPDEEREQPYTRRSVREELVGFLGIALVLLALPIIWFIWDVREVGFWRWIPLALSLAAVLGVVLMLRVPGVVQRRSRDPQRPLTRLGSLPIVERPATLLTRVSLVLGVLLVALMLSAYTVAALPLPDLELWALPLTLLAGLALLAQGGLVIGGRFPPPAIFWQRVTITGGAPRTGWRLVTAGIIGVGASLTLALFEGYVWGYVGLAVLAIILVSLAPLARSAPTVLPSESSQHEWEDVE